MHVPVDWLPSTFNGDRTATILGQIVVGMWKKEEAPTEQEVPDKVLVGTMSSVTLISEDGPADATGFTNHSA